MTSTDRFSGLAPNLAIKAPCRAATTANITLSGAQTIDGVAVVADDRVLVKDQTDQTENGIYDASATAWTRAKDFDGARDVVKGTQVLVTSGTTAAGIQYQLTTTNPITIDTSNLTFEALVVSTANAILTGLGAMGSGTGMVAQTAAATFAKRTLTGTANQVVISNGTGVSGNPTFSTPQDIGTASVPTFGGVILATGGSLKTSTSAGNTALLQAYDVNGTAYTTFATLTANNTPTLDLDDAVTKASNYIYRAAGTDVPVTDGGTGASTAATARVNLGVDQIDFIESDGTTPSSAPTVDASAQDGLAIGSGSSVGASATGALAFAGATVTGVGAVGIRGTTSANYSTTVGGLANTASNVYAVVVGGATNTASATGALVLAGTGNTASGNSSVVAGGDSNTASGTYTEASGYGATASQYGQVARSVGGSSNQQVSNFQATLNTTTVTPGEMFLDGTSTRLVIPTDTTWGFDIMVVARRTDADNESAFYRFEGCIDNNAGTTALVGSVVSATPIEDTAAWACAVTADNANDALIITVTGENGKTIQWLANITILQVTG